jgi:CYTH domain-containing protein
MAIEIERKFLVLNDSYKKESYRKLTIKQGFLNSNYNRVVRVRIIGDKGYLTVKGKSSEDGTSRFEWEKEISIEEAVSLLAICEKGVIEKVRYLIKQGFHIYEVDEFHKENEGLVVAEIELSSANENFIKPSWLGKEVTGITKYYNSELSNTPFNSWA